MYQISQEQKDELFRRWITEQNHKLEILAGFGFTQDQAIEMLKEQTLQIIAEK
mgnify:CR=1 FL=1